MPECEPWIYCDPITHAPYLPADGVPFSSEYELRAAEFAVHPQGFPIFVPGAALEHDEYANGDPYSVAAGLELQPAFQQRRLETTVELAGIALGQGSTQRTSKDDDDPSNAFILDVACGEGHITRALRAAYPVTHVWGVDYSVRAIEAAARAECQFACADAHRLPFGEGQFRVIVLNNIWEHVPDPLVLVAEAKRVLRHDGSIIISTPSRYRLRNIGRVLIGKPVSFMSPLHVTEYTVGQIKEQLQFAGLTVQVVDRPLRGKAKGFSRKFAFGVVAPILRGVTRAIGSHHSWEQTVFYVAQKEPKATSGALQSSHV